MTQPLCSKLKKWINHNLNSKPCCQQFNVVPYKEFNFQNDLRRYQPSVCNSLSIGKRYAGSLTKQQNIHFGPIKKIKTNEPALKDKQIKNKTYTKKQFCSHLTNQKKRIQRQNQREQHGQKQQNAIILNFKININKKIKSLKPSNIFQECNQQFDVYQIQKEKQLQNEQNNIQILQELQIPDQKVQQQDNQHILKQNQLQNEQKIIQHQMQQSFELEKKKNNFWKDQQQNQLQQINQINDIHQFCQAQNEDQFDQTNQNNQYRSQINKCGKQNEEQSEIQKQQIIENNFTLSANIFEFQNKKECREDKIDNFLHSPQKNKKKIQTLNFVNEEKSRILVNKQDAQNSMNFINIKNQEISQKINGDKKGFVGEALHVIKTKKYKKIKDQIIITRAQESNLHLLNKLSLRLLRQKYGQQETIDSLTQKILQDEKQYHIQGVLQTKNRIVNQLTLPQKTNIIKKYLSEQQQSFKLKIR